MKNSFQCEGDLSKKDAKIICLLSADLNLEGDREVLLYGSVQYVYV